MHRYKDFESITPTAILTAYPRIFTDIPYSKEIFDLLKKKVTITDDLLNDLLAPELEARYKLTDKFLKENNINQVLEIAAGYSQRGMIQSQNGIDYIELDLDSVCKTKNTIIKSIINMPNNLHLISGNAIELDDFKKCEKYFDQSKEIAIIHEGLFRYLTFAEKEKVAKNIYYLLNKYGGVWITCDLTPRRFLVNQNKVNPALNKDINNITSRNNINDRFDNKEHVTDFLEKIGFSVEFHDFKEAKSILSSPKKLNLSDERVVKILDGAIVAVIKINKNN